MNISDEQVLLIQQFINSDVSTQQIKFLTDHRFIPCHDSIVYGQVPFTNEMYKFIVEKYRTIENTFDSYPNGAGVVVGVIGPPKDNSFMYMDGMPLSYSVLREFISSYEQVFDILLKFLYEPLGCSSISELTPKMIRDIVERIQ